MRGGRGSARAGCSTAVVSEKPIKSYTPGVGVTLKTICSTTAVSAAFFGWRGAW